jgi:hypothetical protein
MIFVYADTEVVMDDELFAVVYQTAWELWPKREKRVQFAGRTIVLMYLWSVIRGKPRQWVCDRRNLPPQLCDESVPSRSQFGRRLNSPPVQAMLAELEARVRQCPQAASMGCWLLDGKPLVVSPYSKDKAAKWGWAYDRKARGYKLFAMVDLDGNVIAWRLDSMNQAEPIVARELIEHIDRPGYILGDSIYDSGPLHEHAAQRDLQLIAPRKIPGGNIGIRARQPTRLHSIAMLETFNNTFGPAMYACRTSIERAFAMMGCSKVGLDHLPYFIRGPSRVRPWVQAKIILYSLQKPKELQQ